MKNAAPAAAAAAAAARRRFGDLCPDCAELREYTRERNDRCPYMQTRSFCQFCPDHCYRPAMRQRIATVMRFSGPRMIYYDPPFAVKHLWAVSKFKRQAKRQAQAQAKQAEK